MTPSARVAAAIAVLDEILAGRRAEQALTAWARHSRFAGSKDRAALRDLVFDALRRRASCAALGGGLHGRGLMIGLGISDGWDMSTVFAGEGHGATALTAEEAARVAAPAQLTVAEAADLPAWLLPMWTRDLKDKSAETADVLRHRAPLYLRVNQRRTTQTNAIAALAADGVETEAHPDQCTCLKVTHNPRRVKTASAYTEGLVEVQDAASQMAVSQLDIPQGARVLDYCAGGGGKALALADMFDCAVFAHDVSAARLKDVVPRAARAGVEITCLDHGQIADVGPFDVVVVDAPCSGSGTWRRNPEAKWALSLDDLETFGALQVEVLTKAAAFVRPGGQLIYMTCSVLSVENDRVVDHFLHHSQGFEPTTQLRLFPSDASDGFFCQSLRNLARENR